ncbi:MAG: hypothetical protein ACYDBH_24735 [Acidobacteriaceae bacterium]
MNDALPHDLSGGWIKRADGNRVTARAIRMQEQQGPAILCQGYFANLITGISTKECRAKLPGGIPQRRLCALQGCGAVTIPGTRRGDIHTGFAPGKTAHRQAEERQAQQSLREWNAVARSALMMQDCSVFNGCAPLFGDFTLLWH